MGERETCGCGGIGGLLGAPAGLSLARFHFVGLRLSTKHDTNCTGPTNSIFTCTGSNPGQSLASGMCFNSLSEFWLTHLLNEDTYSITLAVVGEWV